MKTKSTRVTIRHYANLYGIRYQTLQRARNRGYDLSKPEKLLKSFEDQPGGNKTDLTLLRKIVNGELTDADEPPVIKNLKDGKKSKVAAAVAPPPQLDDDDMQTLSDGVEENAAQVSMALAGGLMEELARLKQETMKSYRLYVAELRPADRMTRQKIWLANVAALRQLAKEAPKAERDARNVLVVADVESAWSRSFKEFKTSAEALGRRVSTLPLFAGLDPVDVEQAIGKEVVTILSHLESGSWLDKVPASE